MGAPKQKYFGNFLIDNIGKAVKQIPNKLGEYKGERQLKVNAAMWDDGNISLSIWDAEKKEEIKLGNLRVSTLDGASAPSSASAPAAGESDLPF